MKSFAFDHFNKTFVRCFGQIAPDTLLPSFSNSICGLITNRCMRCFETFAKTRIVICNSLFFIELKFFKIGFCNGLASFAYPDSNRSHDVNANY
jgi:hypothetical protein